MVNGWHDFELINIQKIRDVIASFDPHVVNVFSFAVCDEHQRRLFDGYTRQHIEQAIGRLFSLVPTVDTDIIPMCCREMGISRQTVDLQEMSNFWSKQGAFRLCMRRHVVNHRAHRPNLPLHVLLLDDAVYNETLRWPDLQATVEQRNIDQL